MTRDEVFKVLESWLQQPCYTRAHNVARVVNELRTELDEADELHFDEVCELKKQIAELNNKLKRVN